MNKYDIWTSHIWRALCGSAGGKPSVITIGLLTLWVSVRTYRRLGLAGDRLHGALLLGHLNLAAIAAGILSTPDAALFFCWTLVISELLAALAGNKRRWITAGLAFGL